MYQSLLPIVKPLVFEGKSGVLQVTHKYDDQAQLFVQEGIIEQVKTKHLQGKKAVATCARWVNITTRFEEGKQDDYTPDPEIDTNDFLSFLEKSAKNIEVIRKKIAGDDAVFQIDSNKLNNAKKLGAEDLKIALLFDGKRSIEQILPLSGKSELAVLTHTCRLIMSGVAGQATAKDVLPKEEREAFLQALDEKLTDLVGPAGSILVEDALETIGSRTDMLTQDEISPLLSAIGTMLEDDEKVSLDEWGEKFV